MGCVIQFLKECRTSALISPPVPARDVLPKSSIKASTTLTASLEAVPAAARPKWLLALRSLFFSASLSEIFLPLAMWSTACPTWKMSVITSGWNGSITCFDDVSSGKKNKLILLSLIFFPDFMSRIWEQTYGLPSCAHYAWGGMLLGSRWDLELLEEDTRKRIFGLPLNACVGKYGTGTHP